MKTQSNGSGFPRFSEWLKRNSEGEGLLEWVVYFIVFIVLVVFILNRPADLPNWRFYGTVVDLALVLVLNILWMNRVKFILPSPAGQWLFLISTEVLVLAAVGVGGLYDDPYLLFMLGAQASVTLGVWPIGVIISLVNLAAWLGVFWAMGATLQNLFSYGTSVLVGIVFTSLLVVLLERYSEQTRRAKQLLRDLQLANEQLETSRQKEKELAIAEERVRLARDIHDGLGHHLTVLSIQLQAVDKLVGRNPQAAAEAIQVCRAETQAALDEVRYSVGMMRQPALSDQPLAEVLAALVTNFGQRSGLETSFEQSGSAAPLTTFARQTLYRAVQESLTNVQKHGKNVRHIWIRLVYSNQAVQLAVTDDGQKPETAPGSQMGYGLEGLRERVSQLGGTVSSGPGLDAGFEVQVSIPLQEVVYDPGRTG
jgi:signal transduction histidine kinase